MSRVLIFAGTTEGRLLAQRFDGLGEDALVCVATEYGEEVLPPMASVRVRAGRMGRAEMEALMRREGARLAIDATHPYAREATREIRAAGEAAGIPVLRCLRPEGACREEIPEEAGKWIVRFPSLEDAVRWLSGREGNILAVTGSKELSAYRALPDFAERVYARVLPSAESVSACREAGLSGRHIIGMQGPFSVAMNLAVIREFDCRYLVTKDGGREGGMEEKLKAAARAGILAVVIDRPGREEGMTVEEVMDWYERQCWT